MCYVSDDLRELEAAAKALGTSFSSDQLVTLLRGDVVPFGALDEKQCSILAALIPANDSADRPVSRNELLREVVAARGCSGIAVKCWGSKPKCCLYVSFLGVCVKCHL